MYKIEYNDSDAERFYNDYLDIVRSVLDEEINKLEKVECSYNTTAISFLKNYRKSTFLKKLLTARPKELIQLEQEENNRIKSSFEENTKEFIEILKSIFSQRLYSETLRKKNFYKSKNILICPYCGQNYIFLFEKSNVKADVAVKHHIDHFLPKSEYPLLSFSYYNLIPSCTTCNMSPCKTNLDPLGASDNQGNKGLKICNPYEFDNNELLFSFNLINFNYFGEEDIRLNYNFKPPYSIEAYQLFFGLQSLYDHHQSLIFELIIKKQFWSSFTNLRNYEYLGLKGLSSNIVQAFFGFHSSTKNFGKRPLAKLMFDISKYYDKLYKIGRRDNSVLLDKIRAREY